MRGADHATFSGSGVEMAVFLFRGSEFKNYLKLIHIGLDKVNDTSVEFRALNGYVQSGCTKRRFHATCEIYAQLC